MLTPTNELLTREETAALLGIKPDTLAIWASTKRYALPYAKIGRSVRYKLSDVQKFIESRTITQA